MGSLGRSRAFLVVSSTGAIDFSVHRNQQSVPVSLLDLPLKECLDMPGYFPQIRKATGFQIRPFKLWSGMELFCPEKNLQTPIWTFGSYQTSEVLSKVQERFEVQNKTAVRIETRHDGGVTILLAGSATTRMN